jgi:hypothetical protein
MFDLAKAPVPKALSGVIGGAILSLLSQPAAAEWGRAEDIVTYKGIQYDGACLYYLATENEGVPDAQYEPLMAGCLWNGVENPSSPGIPTAGPDTFDCLSSMICVRATGTRIK